MHLKPLVQRIVKSLQSIFQFDLRSLSLMRIGVGSVILLDLFIRISNIAAHYTNKGVLPLEALFRFAWNEHYFSFYSITGSLYIQFLVFLVNIVCAIALLLGYRTRLATILCWLFLISIHNRNPYIHQGGDDLLRLLTFWGIFLPWNSYFSIDRQLGKTPVYQSTVISTLAGFAYMIQVGYVYFFSAVLKSSPEWTSEYTAIYYALSLDQIALPFSKLIYPYGSFLKAMTFFVYHLEFYLPFALLIPFFTSYFRLLFISLILLLHIGISLTLNVGLFPLIGTVSLLGLLPGTIADKLFSYIKSILPDKLPSIFNPMKQASAGLLIVHNYKESLIKRGILLYFIIYVFNWNLSTIERQNLVDNPHVQWIGMVLRIDQHWGMFSPGVFKDDGWFVFEGKTTKGKYLDILQQGKEVSYQKLASVSKPFTEDRWRKYMENNLFVSHAHIRPYYCGYLLDKWNSNKSKSEQIDTLKIIYMKEISLPDYKTSNPIKELLCECYR